MVYTYRWEIRNLSVNQGKKGGKNTTQANNANGNGNNPQPQIEKVYEPLDEQRWVELDTETGRREIAFSGEVTAELGIEEEDTDSEFN